MKKIEGIITALVTPFKNSQVDYKSLKNLVKNQLDQGVDGFVVHGTTSESPTTTDSEKEEIFRFIKAEVSGQVPLIVGSGTNSTQDTIERSKRAQQWGADALLLVVPYYNKPPQRGLVEHFNQVANSVAIPSILYNVPGRTITSMDISTVVTLSENSNIIGIKEATGNMEFGEEIIKQTRKDFVVLSGDDKTSMILASKGGRGVIAVASHMIGNKMKDAYRKIKEGNLGALKEYEKLFGLIDSIYLESNPIPVKYALYKMGIIDNPDMRLPLVTLSDNVQKIIDQKLKENYLC